LFFSVDFADRRIGLTRVLTLLGGAVAAWRFAALAGSRRKNDATISRSVRLAYLSAADFGASNSV